ncbi:MAG: UvrD-helicase domain-containing protein, partial [Clostridia bacterium]|nr:UvrD-helicase domain-containing protein [Clostridia bacterium]
RVQDLIFYALSKDETNIFMVGDVKQSIYSFRNAEPALFLEKQRSSNPVTDLVPLTAPSRVDLNKNFRSDKKILDFVNSVFEPLMTPENDGIDYSDGHAFVTESDAPPSESEVQIHLLLSGTGENSPLVKLSRMQAEAKYVADKIKSLLESATVFDKDTKKKRKAVPSDIAVLMRAPKVDSQCFENAFKEAGIPYINNNPSENYLDTSEVRSVLAYLQVINNPYDDVPLVTLMYSDFFGFSATELANIRIEAKHALFFDAVKKYAKKDNKTAEFLKKIEYLRSLSLTTDVYGIISAVYETSGILLRVSEKENSEAVKANLMLLLDYAEGFEADRYRGLFSFINYILKLSEKGDAIPAAKLKKTGGSVNILSVHGSKGLEYPIVFFVGAGTEMQRKGENVIQTDLSLGVGGCVRDSKLHREFESSARKLLIEKKREKGLEEAKRLLYVALTRPRDHLYITASMNASDFEKSMLSVYRTNGYPNRFDIDEKASFIKWMMYSLIRTEAGKTLCTAAGVPCDLCTDPSVADVMVTNVTEYEAEKQKGKQLKPTLEIDKEEAKALISRQYSHISDLSLPSKLSVSEIKGLRNNTPDSEPVFEKRAYFKKPSFITGGTGKDKGNATHHFLQFCDFDKITDMHSLLEEKQRLVEYEFITEKEAKLVEDEKVLRFLTSETMKKLSESDKCEKEKRFIFTLPANELMDTDSKSEIIVQGILDCLYVKDGKAIIVDYKTDTVSDAGILLSRYSAQLDMYEKAVKHIIGMDTYKKYIYSFCLEQFIEV